MRKKVTSIAVALLLVVAGCSSSDPTSSDKYAALEQELAQTKAQLEIAQVEAQLERVTAERDALAAANEALSEQLSGEPAEKHAPMSQPASDMTTGQIVSVTIEGLEELAGQEVAGVLYDGDELSLSVAPGAENTDSDRAAVGGFQVWIGSDDVTTTQIVRQPEDGYAGPFPYVSDDALTVEPGVYTLILWADYGLSPISRWVPVNSDGQGLTGCQHVFEVGDDAQTDVIIGGVLSPDGWDVACVIP